MNHTSYPGNLNSQTPVFAKAKTGLQATLGDYGNVHVQWFGANLRVQRRTAIKCINRRAKRCIRFCTNLCAIYPARYTKNDGFSKSRRGSILSPTIETEPFSCFKMDTFMFEAPCAL